MKDENDTFFNNLVLGCLVITAAIGFLATIAMLLGGF